MSTSGDVVAVFNALNMKQILSVKDMVAGAEYLIVGAERVTTKYGDCILLELTADRLYLPKRFNALADKDLESLSAGAYIISKIPLNNGSDETPIRLEIKKAPPMREYYPFSSTFSSFK